MLDRIVFISVIVTVAAVTGSTAHAQSTANHMALDVDARTLGVQPSSSVPTGDAFTLEMHVVSVDPAGFFGYQWEIEYEEALLDFEGGVVNHLADDGIELCAVVTVAPSPLDSSKTRVGQGACVSRTIGFATHVLGSAMSLTLRCEREGVATIRLFPVGPDAIFGTALVAPSSALYPTSLSDATVTCSAPCPADVNGDGSVTPADIGLVARAMHATSGSPRWNPATDIDGDGLTTQRDLLAVIRARRECGGSVR